MGVLEALQSANPLRNAEWDPEGDLDLSFFANELAGEGGEAAAEVLAFLMAATRLSIAIGRASNVVKKLDREALGLRGSRASRADLAAELGDVVICASLVACCAGIDLPSATRDKFNATSSKIGLSITI
jgi:NTP pyrophosphatase (non-canonical NTP hydrolase)